jgi:DNA anti-recombination protein RmuC
VLAELKSQKEDIARLGVELGKKVEEVARGLLQRGEKVEESVGSLQMLRESTQREVQKMVQQVESCPVLAEAKWSEADIKLKVEQPSIQLPTTQSQQSNTPLFPPAQPVLTPFIP